MSPNPLNELLELAALDSRQQLLRIPSQQDVPITSRIGRLIDSQPFQRLRRISQLGLVSLVYPGATHTRFEHSLGVYRMALLFLKRMKTVPGFCQRVSIRQAELFVVAALLHDIGHWPYCHPIEDLGLSNVLDHEFLAEQRIVDSEIPEILKAHFQLETSELVNLLSGNFTSHEDRILGSMLSGPVDVDKMDYLYRDSHHAGVPYGMNFDQNRLIGSLCLDDSGSRLAITEKGTTAAELMVFARYVMFSEVYWHHTVRAATAMLQRLIFGLKDRLDWDQIFRTTEAPFHDLMIEQAAGTPFESLALGLFSHSANNSQKGTSVRQTYKRLAQFTLLENGDLFRQLSRRPYPWLVQCGEHLRDLINRDLGVQIQPHQLLIDAPPPGLEVQFKIDVRETSGQYRCMSEKSPVVRTLAQEQFDNFVKRLRIFVAPQVRQSIRDQNISADEISKRIYALLNQAIEMSDAGQKPE